MTRTSGNSNRYSSGTPPSRPRFSTPRRGKPLDLAAPQNSRKARVWGRRSQPRPSPVRYEPGERKSGPRRFKSHSPASARGAGWARALLPTVAAPQQPNLVRPPLLAPSCENHSRYRGSLSSNLTVSNCSQELRTALSIGPDLQQPAL